MIRSATSGSVALALLSFVTAARAQESSAHEASPAPTSSAGPEANVGGVEEPAQQEDDGARTFGEVVLFIPRHVVEFLYLGTSAAIAVIQNETVVPRVQQLVSAPGGKLYVLPTLFADTNSTFDIGARLIVDQGDVASGLRIGFGGPNSFEVETRFVWRIDAPIRSLFTAEALYRRDNDQELLGIGQDPMSDARNRYLPGQAGTFAEYFTERWRAIVTVAARPHDLLEVVLSGSFDRRRTEDARDEDEVLSTVFEPNSLVGAFETYSMLYGETALRLDSRPTRGKPSPGVLAETYAGSGHAIMGLDARLVRYGGRIAGFIPLYRTTNILQLRVIGDGVASVEDHPLPFEELTRQPDFRGLDERRDRISLVGSVDYRWLVVTPIAASLFVDAAIVAPRWDRFDFGALRWAVGTAVDLHSDEAVLGQLGFAAGPDGARVLLSLGVSTGFGDRTHRP